METRGGKACYRSLIKDKIFGPNFPYSPEKKRRIQSVSNNVVQFYKHRPDRCTDTYITPICILTAAHCGENTTINSNRILTKDGTQIKTYNAEFIVYTYESSEHLDVNRRLSDLAIIKVDKPKL